MELKNFYFIGDRLEQTEETPFPLYDNFILTRPNPDQTNSIKGHIEGFQQAFSIMIRANKYEYKLIQNPDGSYAPKHLPENEWKYYIVEYPKSNFPNNFELVLSLSKKSFSVLLKSIYHGLVTKSGKELPGMGYNPLKNVNYFHDDYNKGFISQYTSKTIDKEDSKEFSYISKALLEFDKRKEEFPFIEKALKDYEKIAEISIHSPFKILSCFSIIELLLTTYKSKNETAISYQLEKKVNLLNNQFTEKIKIEDFFNGSDSNTIETVISKLYRYRNNIAHGNTSDFEKELKIFKHQQEKIYPFLNTLLKKILISTVESPQLISDLKKC
jgi:hypothetical protein